MAKNPYKSDEIKAKVVNRLHEVLEESGKTQRDFGKEVLEIDNNDPFTNDIFKGRKKLSRQKAQLIINHYPHLRIPWLLGEDDYKTEAERVLKADLAPTQMRGTLFSMFAELCGYHIYIEKPTAPNDIEEIINNIHRGYLIQYGSDIVGRISLEKFNLLSLDIQELVEQKIRSYIRESEVQ